MLEQEREPEETVKITRVEVSETLVEDRLSEETKVVGEYKEETNESRR